MKRRNKGLNTPKKAPSPLNWAERIAQNAESNKRRYEHWMHVKYCQGEYDHLVPRKEATERRARCKKICGLCRYINSLPVWPDPKYCCPSEDFLKALEEDT